MKFKEALHSKKTAPNVLESHGNTLNEAPKSITATKEEEGYHGQVLEKDSDEESETGDNEWFAGKLKFRKHVDDSYRNRILPAAGDGRFADDYAVVDTRIKK